MAVEKYPGPQKKDTTQNSKNSVSADAPLSRKTMEAVVVFSSNEDFLAASYVALEKQDFVPLSVSARARIADLCAQGFLNYLLDCDLPDLREVQSTMTTIRSRAPNSFIIAYCPNTVWSASLKEAGANTIITGGENISLQIMDASTGFLQNINSIISQYHKSTRRKIKEATSRSRMEKAAAMAVHLSFEHMLQTDANMRAFFANSWPPSRHGQYVAIADGKTIAFGSDARELAEQVMNFGPSENILIQRIDCENVSISQHAI
jgi:tRNA(Leu) C34 or U34 (ribose-2'-O)-methylase TrmL